MTVSFLMMICNMGGRFNRVKFSRSNRDVRYKKSASSHDEAALLGKKYHIAAKIIAFGVMCKFFRHFFD